MNRIPYLIIPVLVWFFLFLLVPMGIVVLYSFSMKGPYGGVVFHFSIENYLRAFDIIYLRVFWNSLKLATFTTVFCLLIGYPMAYAMVTMTRRFRPILVMAVMIPFWTNFIVRAYATKLILSEHGPVNQLVAFLGLFDKPISFDNTNFAVWIGMVMNYLPFMVLPLFVAIEKFDFSLLDAAKDLGASSLRSLWTILIPMTKSGILSGIVFVFAPALGEFVIPDLLGGSKTMLIGNLITEQFLKARDWPFGASLSLVLILIVIGSLLFYLRLENKMQKSYSLKKLKITF